MEQLEMVGVLFPKQLKDRVKTFSKLNDRSMGYIIRKATEQYLDKQTEQPAESNGDGKRDGRKGGK